MRKSIILTLISIFLSSFQSRAMEPDDVVKRITPQSIAIKSIIIENSSQNPKDEFESLKAIAVKNYKKDTPKPRKKLDLKDYPCFTSDLAVTNSEYGNQFKDYGPFEHVMLTDVQHFLSTESNPMTWVEVAAAYGAFSLRAFERTQNPVHARFIVNDLCEKNLQSLQNLMRQNEELASAFKLIPGDCLTLHQTPSYKQNVPKGADFLSALNLIHYQSPNEVVHFFANASESLKMGGKFYVMHDLERGFHPDPCENAVFKIFSKDNYEILGAPRFNLALKMALKDATAKQSFIKMKFEFIVNFQKNNRIDFPYFLSKKSLNEVLNTPVDMFRASPEFIEDVALIVGLKLEREIPLDRMLRNDIVTIVNAETNNPTAMGYVFVKEKNVFQLRDTPAFKELIDKTRLADQQREKIKFRSTLLCPFMEEYK